MNSLINRVKSKIPEMHLKNYSFCGPFTKTAERMAAGERGINKLDSQCMKHDILYSQTNDPLLRRKSDQALIILPRHGCVQKMLI